MNLRRILPVSVALAVVVAVGGYMYFGQQQQQEQKSRRARAFQDQPAPVLVARAAVSDVPVYLDAVGTTKALNTVTVRPQVDGKLMKLSFVEGQDVKRGDVIAEIDPRTYQAALDQVVAKKAQDEATLANARIDLERYTRLVASNSGSKQQADTQKATVAQLEALVNLDQAAIDNARTIVEYTRIVAPLSGRTGIRQVDEGNIIRASDATGIVTITEIRPISIFFNLPQQQFSQVSKAFAQGSLPVDAIANDGRTVVDRGKLQVIDNQMDQTTGTIRMKAEFPNPELQLWPGQFINIRLLVETLKQVIVVPTASVQRGPNGTFVYVVSPENTVAVRPIAVGQQDDTRAVITTGLKAEEQVVTTGFTRLSNGTKVSVQAGDGQPQPDAKQGAPGEAAPTAGPQAPEPAQPARRRKREGAENTDGKDRRRSENTPGSPSVKQ